MWPFKKKAPDGPSYKLAIGQRCLLIDGKEWDNEKTRHLIGRQCVITDLGLPFNIRPAASGYKSPYYQTKVEGYPPNFIVAESLLRPIDDPFAEPRDMSDETPWKPAKWADVPLFTPTKVKEPV